MKEVVIGKLQPRPIHSCSRVLLAGDYLGILYLSTLYTESAITTGFYSAGQEAASPLATERQQGQRSLRIGGLAIAGPHVPERTY